MSSFDKDRFHELLSALQKCIRRNMEYEALSFALELEGLNSTALWNRLKIIASEDIGCANPQMPILVETLEKHYLKAKEKLNDDSKFLFLTNAIVCMCRSNHSRIVDNLLYLVKHENKVIEIPNFALDGIHTARKTTTGEEGWDKLENDAKLEKEDEYKTRAKKLRK